MANFLLLGRWLMAFSWAVPEGKWRAICLQRTTAAVKLGRMGHAGPSSSGKMLLVKTSLDGRMRHVVSSINDRMGARWTLLYGGMGHVESSWNGRMWHDGPSLDGRMRHVGRSSDGRMGHVGSSWNGRMWHDRLLESRKGLVGPSSNGGLIFTPQNLFTYLFIAF